MEFSILGAVGKVENEKAIPRSSQLLTHIWKCEKGNILPNEMKNTKSTAVGASDLFYNPTHADANLDPMRTNGKCGEVTFAQIFLRPQCGFTFQTQCGFHVTRQRVLHHSRSRNCLVGLFLDYVVTPHQMWECACLRSKISWQWNENYVVTWSCPIWRNP